MSPQKIHPLRALTDEELNWLERISRSYSEPAAHVTRAKEILAVAGGSSYQKSSRKSGWEIGRCGLSVGWAVQKEGILAIQGHPGGKPTPKYQANERERVLAEARRQPDPERDGTNTWSLTTLQKAFRKAEDGLPEISTERICVILQESGYRWHKSRSWCETGEVARKRKRGVVKVTDPDTTPKKS
jgi:transposase